MQEQHQDAVQAHAEATVRRDAVAEEVQVEREFFRVHPLFDGLRLKDLDAVFALRAGRDLGAVEEQVVALRELRVLLVAHVVERANRGVVVGEEDELVAVLFLDVGRDLALTLGVHVGVGAGHLVAAVLHDLLGLGQGDAGERALGDCDLDLEVLQDRLAVLLLDRGEAGDDELLVERHDVLVRVNPAELGVDRGELGRVSRSERGVGAERRGDLEDAAEACGLRHLLEELGALREVCLLAEVLDLEELGARLGGAGHELGGVDLDEVALDPNLAHRVLERSLHAEDELLLGATQIEDAPVEALVEA